MASILQEDSGGSASRGGDAAAEQRGIFVCPFGCGERFVGSSIWAQMAPHMRECAQNPVPQAQVKAHLESETGSLGGSPRLLPRAPLRAFSLARHHQSSILTDDLGVLRVRLCIMPVEGAVTDDQQTMF